MRTGVQQVLVFTLLEARYGLAVRSVQEIALRVRVTPLPGAPAPVVGLVRYRGEVAVAVDMRARFGAETRAPSLDDHFVLARTPRRLVALVVDRVIGFRAIADDAVTRPPVTAKHVDGIVEIEDGLVLLHDLDAVLSLDEERVVDAAMQAR